MAKRPKKTSQTPTEAPNTPVGKQTTNQAITETPKASTTVGTTQTPTGEQTTLSPTTNAIAREIDTIPPIPIHVTTKKRLERDGRWAEAEPIRDQLMYHARKTLKLSRDDARAWAYGQLDEQFPPIPEPEIDSTDPDNATQSTEIQEGDDLTAVDSPPDNAAEPTPANPARPRGEQSGVNGLNELPDDWPPLPANAQLPVEIQWVQSNRLSVVRETADGTSVDLSQSLSPAPSYAALGWLETSIRAYAKYCEIAAKATQAATDDTAVVRREKKSIQEIRDILAEMLETGENG